MFKYSFYACVIGFILDFIFGDPCFSLHPIRLIGALIAKTEGLLRGFFSDNEKTLRLAGMLMVLIVCTLSFCTAYIIIFFAYKIHFALGIVAESIICYFALAAKALKTESMKVYTALKRGDTEGGRAAVAMIVGRDTAVLDEKGIIKAAVETVAENLSDGVIAPLFYMLIGGGSLGMLYKAINTIDSMVGYKNEKYIFFGSFGAKLDDIANLIPSRISAVMMIAAAFLLKMDYKNAIKIFKRDRLKHASPNSAQTEAVCAGALDIRLAGDAYYFGKLYKKPYIGDEIKEINVENVADANRLMYVSAVLTIIVLGALRLIAVLAVGGLLYGL